MAAGQVVVVTGASSGSGRLTAESLARAGHTVVAGMRATTTRNAKGAEELRALAAREGLALEPVELDVQDDGAVASTVDATLGAHGRIDQSVADEIVRVVALPPGARPFRTHVDPARDGSEVVSVVADRIRAEFFHRVGISDLLSANAAH